MSAVYSIEIHIHHGMQAACGELPKSSRFDYTPVGNSPPVACLPGDGEFHNP